MEFIYAIERDDLFQSRIPHGFLAFDDTSRKELEPYLHRIEENGFFLQRSAIEDRMNFQQIIPYIVLVHEDQIFETQRTTSQEEERLHQKCSIGLGGHINPVDTLENSDQNPESSVSNTQIPSDLERGMYRELNEEAQLNTDYVPEFSGFINDDTNDVGAVHFGAVFRLELEKPDVEIRESEKMTGSFSTLDELLQKKEESPDVFETWSYYLLEHPKRLLNTSG